MNKIAIPAILVATVMVAGMFAFMPVEQASTVHLTTIDTLTDSILTTGGIFDSTAITSVQGTTATQTYTYTADETFEIWAISVTADISAFTTSADTVEVSALTVNGVTIVVQGAPLLISDGADAGATTIDIILALVDGIAVAVPENGDVAVIIEVTEFGSNDANTAIPITVRFETYARGDAIEGILVS